MPKLYLAVFARKTEKLYFKSNSSGNQCTLFPFCYFYFFHLYNTFTLRRVRHNTFLYDHITVTVSRDSFYVCLILNCSHFSRLLHCSWPDEYLPLSAIYQFCKMNRVVLWCLVFVASVRAYSSLDFDVKWEMYKKKYNKHYTPDEEPYRREIWKSNFEVWCGLVVFCNGWNVAMISMYHNLR